MKKYFALIFCVLLGIYVGTSCKSSDTTGKAGNSAAAKTGNTPSGSAIPAATKEKIEAAKAAKVDQRMGTMMMKRAEAIAKTHCNCANSKSKENCEARTKRSYDASLKRLPENKHEEFKATYNSIVEGCK
ncbi:MAG: hypothetical protein ACPG49_10590 [Chitinophagales bacterium]